MGNTRFDNSVMEAFHLVKWYAQEHVLLCLVPAFFIAGAIGVFVSQESVMRCLGRTASMWIAYPVASFSGTVLPFTPARCGLFSPESGPAEQDWHLPLGSLPAINVLALILTARILGLELGVALAVGQFLSV